MFHRVSFLLVPFALFCSSPHPPCSHRFTMPSSSAFLPAPSSHHTRFRRKLSPLRMSTATPDNAPATPQHHHLGLDWRAFRAHLVSTQRPRHHLDAAPPNHWAHRISHLEVGCALIASPSYKWPTSFSHLNHAVVLITDVTDSAISGLLLNRPTRYKVSQHKSVLGRVGQEFGDNYVNLGGDCSTGTLEMLHSLPPDLCSGASCIVPGLYRGGFNAARTLVQNSIASPSQFQFFVAYSRWTWDQFWAEMDRGAWILASCSPSLMLLGPPSDLLWKRVNSALSRGS